MKRFIAFILIATFAVGAVGCARQPSVKTAEHKIKKFFVKYGKKYPDTEFGRNRVTDVDIVSQEEIHKYLVSTKALLTLGTTDIKKVGVTLEKKAYIWRVVSWENLL